MLENMNSDIISAVKVYVSVRILYLCMACTSVCSLQKTGVLVAIIMTIIIMTIIIIIIPGLNLHIILLLSLPSA